MSRNRRPAVLVDSAVLDGSARSLPLNWLRGIEALPYPPRRVLDAPAKDLGRAEAVLVRSMTRIGEAELAQLPQLRAVATLSSGLDHLNEWALEAGSVAICSGHGGNATAVADWVDWAAGRLVGPLRDADVLVVGVGAVGALVSARLQERGARVWHCDPPRARREDGFVSHALSAVPPCALVTLHVPLHGDSDATNNLWNQEQLSRHPRTVLLQACRGGVLDEEAALAALASGQLRHLAVDTWVGEPHVDRNLLAAAALATPHIAGHSIAGKLDIAFRAVQGLRQQLGLTPLRSLHPAVRTEERRHGGLRNLQIPARLDDIAANFRAQPGQFEALRHGHLRTQTARS